MKTSSAPHLTLAILILIATCCTGSLRAEDLPLLDDAQIIQSNPTWNYGSHQNLAVISTAGSQRYSFIHFEVEHALPDNTRVEDIAQALLYLYVNTVTTTGSFTISKVTGQLWTGNPAIIVEGKAAGAASSGTITWANANMIATDSIYTTVNYAGQADEYIAIDVTELVKQWFTGGSSSNFGLVMKASGTVSLQFDSKENTTTSHAPFIHVTLDKKRVAQRGDVTMGSYTSGPLP